MLVEFTKFSVLIIFFVTKSFSIWVAKHVLLNPSMSSSLQPSLSLSLLSLHISAFLTSLIHLSLSPFLCSVSILLPFSLFLSVSFSVPLNLFLSCSLSLRSSQFLSFLLPLFVSILPSLISSSIFHHSIPLHILLYLTWSPNQQLPYLLPVRHVYKRLSTSA